MFESNGMCAPFRDRAPRPVQLRIDTSVSDDGALFGDIVTVLSVATPVAPVVIKAWKAVQNVLTGGVEETEYNVSDRAEGAVAADGDDATQPPAAAS